MSLNLFHNVQNFRKKLGLIWKATLKILYLKINILHQLELEFELDLAQCLQYLSPYLKDNLLISNCLGFVRMYNHCILVII